MYDPSSAITGTQAVFEAHPENAAVKALATLAPTQSSTAPS